jgi:transcriptional antiterminator NusG
VVRNTPGVTGFIGEANKPIPLEESAIRTMLHINETEEAKPKVNLAVGDAVRVVSGPFQNFVGHVEEVHADKRKLRVRLSMFGRETQVEIDFDEVEKA